MNFRNKDLEKESHSNRNYKIFGVVCQTFAVLAHALQLYSSRFNLLLLESWSKNAFTYTTNYLLNFNS